MKRRQFLHPKHLLTAFDSSDTLSRPNAENDPAALLRVSRQAMATAFEILLPFGLPDALTHAEAALDLVDRLEAQLTVYRNSSEVSRLNRLAATVPVPVEPRLYELLQLAARVSADTAGAFDITAGPLIRAWGFYRRRGRVPSAAERQDVGERVGMRHLAFDDERRAIRYLRPGVEINLGSIGKGYALDRAVELLRADTNLRAALLHGGHSSVYAIGTRPGDARGWTVGLRHPWQPGARLALVRLRDRALATSAATFQHLEHEGRKLGHILDPRTGWPAEGMASVTVLAPTAAEADALATAFFIQGATWARGYCAAHPEVAAVFLPEGDDAHLEVMGLTDSEIDLHPPAN